MRRLMDVYCGTTSRLRAAMNAATLRRTGSLIAAGLVCASSQAFAQAQAKPDQKPNVEIKADHAEHVAEPAIPHCLEKLKLSDEQQSRAKDVIRSYDAKLETVWKQFGEKYMATIRTECLLLAAVEDGLTEQQRTAVHAQRRQIANAEIGLAGTTTKANQATEKPADPVEQVKESGGITLTAEQEAAADKVQLNYSRHIRSLNRDIEGLHNRLVSLEADKLVELEKILTKAQLVQLRESRQTIIEIPKVTATEKTSRIAE